MNVKWNPLQRSHQSFDCGVMMAVLAIWYCVSLADGLNSVSPRCVGATSLVSTHLSKTDARSLRNSIVSSYFGCSPRLTVASHNIRVWLSSACPSTYSTICSEIPENSCPRYLRFSTWLTTVSTSDLSSEWPSLEIFFTFSRPPMWISTILLLSSYLSFSNSHA